MSDLVVYCISKPFKTEPGMLAKVINGVQVEFKYMSSFDENTGKKYMIDNNRRKFQVYHQHNLSRIYPAVCAVCIIILKCIIY